MIPDDLKDFFVIDSFFLAIPIEIVRLRVDAFCIGQ